MPQKTCSSFETPAEAKVPQEEPIQGPKAITIAEYLARQPGAILKKKNIKERDQKLTKIPQVQIPKRRGGKKVFLIRSRRVLLDQLRNTTNEDVRQRNKVRILEIQYKLRK